MKAPKLFNEFLNSITIDEKNSKPSHYNHILEIKRLQEVSSDLVLTLTSKIEYLQHKLKSVSSHVNQTSSQQQMSDKLVYDSSKVKQDLVINFDDSTSQPQRII